MPDLRGLAVATLTFVVVLSAPCQAGVRDTLPGSVQRVLAGWPPLQNADGTFPDYLHDNRSGRVSGYDEAIVGYSLLLNAARNGDPSQADAAFRTIAWVAAARREPASVFENLAMAAAYNLARARFAHDPRFAAVRPAWQSWLIGIKPVRLTRAKRYWNKHMVEAVSFLELARSGLRSSVPGTVLASPARFRQIAARLLNRHLPRLARRSTTLVAGRPAAVLPDAPAYHGLSLGLLARAIDLLGSDAGKDVRRLLVRMTNASCALVAPDGDLAYFGRSQEQAWALTFTAYGALRAIEQQRKHPSPYLALADRAITRLEQLHMSGPNGFSITPNLASNPDNDEYGLDDYVSSSAYTGLAMMGALWAIDAGERLKPSLRSGSLVSDSNSFALLSSGRSSFATVRRAANWFAVRLDPARGESGDLRLDFGLMSWKTRGGGGGWSDTLPIRPYGRGLPTGGPVLRSGNTTAVASGRRIRIKRTAVRVEGGGFVTRGRVVRKTPFLFLPGPGRLRTEFEVHAGDHVLYSLFLPRSAGIVPTPVGLDSSRVSVIANAPSKLTLGGVYASGREHGLVRATLDYAIRRTGKLRLALVLP